MSLELWLIMALGIISVIQGIRIKRIEKRVEQLESKSKKKKNKSKGEGSHE
jgi:hypothetical protein